MSYRRPSSAAPILAVLAVVLVMLGAYVGLYFWAGERHATGLHVARFYKYRWQATMFAPAASVESFFSEGEIGVVSREELQSP